MKGLTVVVEQSSKITDTFIIGISSLLFLLPPKTPERRNSTYGGYVLPFCNNLAIVMWPHHSVPESA